MLITTIITEDNLQSFKLLFYKTEKKNQPYMKIPTQHYTAGRSLQQFFTGNLQRCFHNLFEWRRFYKVWPIGGAHIRRGACLSGDANSRIYGSWGASWGCSISVILIWVFRYILLKPDTQHRLGAEHILRDTVTLTSAKFPLQTWLPKICQVDWPSN